jgi:hypothetical protein
MQLNPILPKASNIKLSSDIKLIEDFLPLIISTNITDHKILKRSAYWGMLDS